jgi:hypothetical protein
MRVCFCLFCRKGQIAGLARWNLRIKEMRLRKANGLHIHGKMVNIRVYGFVDMPPVFRHFHALGQPA